MISLISHDSLLPWSANDFVLMVMIHDSNEVVNDNDD